MMNTDKVNLPKYENAHSYISSAIEELESVRVGTDKELYKTIERIIDVLSGEMLRLSWELLEPAEERLAKGYRREKITPNEEKFPGVNIPTTE